jgi:hypothetical protein
MTASEMNAPIRKFAALAAAFCGMAGLTACAGAFDARTDATSPVAPRVEALVEANRGYPRWADFPRAAPAPAPQAVAVQVNTLKASGGALAGEVARIEWNLTGDPEAFAAETRARVQAVPVAPITAETQAEIEAFERRARERGRAPPPVDRGPVARPSTEPR